MSCGVFSLTASVVDGAVRVLAAGSPDMFSSLHARLLIAGAEVVSGIAVADGLTVAAFVFPGVPGRVCPEGYELDAFMRRLFVGLNAGSVSEVD